MDKISNEKMLAQVNETRTMLNSIWAGKHHWIGHVLWHGELLWNLMNERKNGWKTYERQEKVTNVTRSL